MSNVARLQCPECGREWTYTGEKNKNERVTCPTCWHKFVKELGYMD